MSRRQRSQGFSLDGYIDVAERLREFKGKHPEGSLQPVDPRHPFTIETIADAIFIVYTAAAYRSPADERPGIGCAWEPFPGKTPYTKDSELQNAETSAWGRAIVAALASDTQKIASAQEVRNRQADRDAPKDEALVEFGRLCDALGLDSVKDKAGFVASTVGREAKWSQLTDADKQAVIAALLSIANDEASLAYDNASRPYAMPAGEPFDVPSGAPGVAGEAGDDPASPQGDASSPATQTLASIEEQVVAAKTRRAGKSDA